jgi:hypothetical protein
LRTQWKGGAAEETGPFDVVELLRTTYLPMNTVEI